MRLTSNSKLALETAMSLKSCAYELEGIDAQRNRIWFVDFDLRISRTHVVADLLDIVDLWLSFSVFIGRRN